MKSAVNVLQELMEKKNQTRPEYELQLTVGPRYNKIYKYTCKAYGLATTAKGSTRRMAQRKAARRMLNELAKQGVTASRFEIKIQAENSNNTRDCVFFVNNPEPGVDVIDMVTNGVSERFVFTTLNMDSSDSVIDGEDEFTTAYYIN